MYRNTIPIRGIKRSNGDVLEVNDMFLTIQGEGIYVGHSAFFIRLSGCNLQCSFCDTDYEDFTEMSVQEIVAKVENTKFGGNLVVITGGEPFRQTLNPLCTSLVEKGYVVQLESNGVLYNEIPEQVKIVCSPKNISGKYSSLNAKILPRITAFKFIISASNHYYNYVPDLGQKEYNIPVYVQPMDEYDKKLNDDNLQLVIRIAKEYGYIVSLQTHKIMDIE